MQAHRLTLFDKIWNAHVVRSFDDETALLYIDRHLVHEVTSPQAFDGLRMSGRTVRRPESTLAIVDHNIPTTDRSAGIGDPDSRVQIETLEKNVTEFGVPYIPVFDLRQGIVHVVGPEQGFSLPGLTIVCGDSHTSTHGAFGALAFGIGTSEVEHVLATQTLRQKPAKNMRVVVCGSLSTGVTAKDLALTVVKTIGARGGAGYVLEYAGEAVRALDMAGRMTLCNMSIEAGARAGLIAPDQVTFDFIRGRPFAPSGKDFDEAVERWSNLASDHGVVFDREVIIDAASIAPMITWGTSPDMAVAIDGITPAPEMLGNGLDAAQIRRALDYMGLQPGQKLIGLPIDMVFIGSCTNGRIEDLRAVAEIARGKKVAKSVTALVVPGSGLVKKQAEDEGIAALLIAAGFEWREAGCSMCLGMNPDRLKPGQRCASTSNRNFEGRQGPGGRTHLMSPVMAAAAAVHGCLVDAREA